MLCITSGPARYDAGPMDITDTLALIESAGGRFGFQLLLAIVCGAVVGIERQMRGKAIGIRTAILICLATQVFTRLSITVSAADAVVDPTRVLGQVVTGVGFLGAGVILARGAGQNSGRSRRPQESPTLRARCTGFRGTCGDD